MGARVPDVRRRVGCVSMRWRALATGPSRLQGMPDASEQPTSARRDGQRGDGRAEAHGERPHVGGGHATSPRRQPGRPAAGAFGLCLI